MDWNDFVSVATKVAEAEGYPVAVLLAQAALETGRNVSSPGNNFFGIKGQGNAGTQNLKTWEDYGQGRVDVNANFAAYKTPEDSVRAYIDLIKRNYPKAWALRDNPVEMVKAIKAGGYATDPAYVAKVTSTPEFKKFANEKPQATPTPTTPFNTSSTPETPLLFDKLMNYIVPQAYAQEAYNPVQTPTGGFTPNYTNSVGGYSPTVRPYNPYTVKQGDTLWDLASKYLGSGNRYNEFGYKGNPNTMPIGTKLNIPNQNRSSFNTSTNRGPVYTPSPTQSPSSPRGVSSGPAQNYTPANANYSSSSGAASYAPPPKTLPLINYSPAKPAQKNNSSLAKALPLGRYL